MRLSLSAACQKIRLIQAKPNINNLFNFFVISLYSILAIFGFHYHEPWRDEAQAWLIARDLNIAGILKQMAYEGSPALWHFILLPFAKLGAPYYSEQIIHLVIGIAVVAIFVLFAPLSKITKFLFVFSSYMAFEYTVIARNYSISILLLFLIAVMYQKRFKKSILYSLLILLLFNTNVHSFFAGLSLILIYLYERVKENELTLSVKDYIAFGIMFISPVIVLYQLIPPDDHMLNNFSFKGLRFFYSMHGIPLTLILFSVLLSLINKSKVLFFLLLSSSWIYYILIFKLNSGRRHYGLIFILIIFALWLSKLYSYKDKLKLLPKLDTARLIRYTGTVSLVVLNLGLAAAVTRTYACYKTDYLCYFSGSKDMAGYIIRHNYDDYVIIAHQGPLTSAVLPYIPGKRFWYSEISSFGTFIIWNNKYLLGTKEPNAGAIYKMKRYFPDSKVLLLLSDPLNHEEEAGKFRLLHKTDKTVWPYYEETYFLYEPI